MNRTLPSSRSVGLQEWKFLAHAICDDEVVVLDRGVVVAPISNTVVHIARQQSDVEGSGLARFHPYRNVQIGQTRSTSLSIGLENGSSLNSFPGSLVYLGIEEGALLCVDFNVFLDDSVDVSRKAKDAYVVLGNHIEHDTTRTLAIVETIWIDFKR